MGQDLNKYEFLDVGGIAIAVRRVTGSEPGIVWLGGPWNTSAIGALPGWGMLRDPVTNAPTPLLHPNGSIPNASRAIARNWS